MGVSREPRQVGSGSTDSIEWTCEGGPKSRDTSDMDPDSGQNGIVCQRVGVDGVPTRYQREHMIVCRQSGRENGNKGGIAEV